MVDLASPGIDDWHGTEAIALNRNLHIRLEAISNLV